MIRRHRDLPPTGVPPTRPARAAPPAVGVYSAAILESLARRTRFVDPDVASRWRDLAGPELADLARPGRLSGGAGGRTLEILAVNGAAAARLAVEEAALLARLAHYFGPGAITRLSIRQAGGGPPGRPGSSGDLSRFRQG